MDFLTRTYPFALTIITDASLIRDSGPDYLQFRSPSRAKRRHACGKLKRVPRKWVPYWIEWGGVVRMHPDLYVRLQTHPLVELRR